MTITVTNSLKEKYSCHAHLVYLTSKFGVREYWVVDGCQQTIEVYRLEQGQLMLVTTLANKDQLTTPLLPAFTCLVSKVFEG